PVVEELEAPDRKAVFRVEEDAFVTEKAMREETAEGIVPAEVVELPERHGALRTGDQAAVHPDAEDVSPAADERIEIRECSVHARELVVAQELAIRMRHLEDGSPAARRTQHVVAGVPYERHAERIDEPALDAREIGERVERERETVVVLAATDADVSEADAGVQRELRPGTPPERERAHVALERLRPGLVGTDVARRTPGAGRSSSRAPRS